MQSDQAQKRHTRHLQYQKTQAKTGLIFHININYQVIWPESLESIFQRKNELLSD